MSDIKLNEEDIVGCGWRIRGNGGGTYEVWTKDDSYWQMDEGGYAPIEEGGVSGLEFWGEEDIRFVAWVNNKEELRQLMKFHNIIPK